jgi:hypothetical protein
MSKKHTKDRNYTDIVESNVTNYTFFIKKYASSITIIDEKYKLDNLTFKIL